MRDRIEKYAPYLGALFILIYWFHFHPPGFGRLGYAEDLGSYELIRRIMADNLLRFGMPHFYATRMMAPFGASGAFYDWSIETDWLGGWLYLWNPDFPWLWIFFGFSLLLSYIGVALILRKMHLSRLHAWGFSLIVVLFNIPRHYKEYYHYSHILLHWAYLQIFFDAWIWQRWWRDRGWTLRSELWRVLLYLCNFGSAGYYWASMLLEWLIVRLCLLTSYIIRKRRGEQVSLDFSFQRTALPLSGIVIAAGISMSWLLPLISEMKKIGLVQQGMGYTANPLFVIRPLWIDAILNFWKNPSFYAFLEKWKIVPVNRPETVVSIGWVFIIPMIIAIVVCRRKRGGPGWGTYAPMMIFFVVSILYFGIGWPFTFQTFLQALVPPMKFFRTLSRLGLTLPPIVGALIALAWPELTAWCAEKWCKRNRKIWAAVIGFTFLSCLEFTALGTPITQMPEMGSDTRAMLERLKLAPGDTVLDMPFCFAGGNGLCKEECTNYPLSLAPSYLTMYHDKKVYGLYEGRVTAEQCNVYKRAPYLNWFDAWETDRCLTSREWGEFCSYLDRMPNHAAVLVYPGIWKAVQNPQCRREFDRHLGIPRETSQFAVTTVRDQQMTTYSDILWYAPRCTRPK